MKKTNKTDKLYESPEMEVFDLMLEGTLCMSGEGLDTYEEYEFGW